MSINDSENSTSGSLRLPESIGGYQIQRVLGSGGMATVYAALQKQPRRTVAIKVMRGAADARAALRRFKREIEILGRLRHAYIAQVYDAGMHEDPTAPEHPVPYFVMEYVPRAKTILEYVAEKQLELRDRLKLFVKVCAGVEHGHARKIIHRDLKPGNILIDEAGDPKIIDFGVARAVELDLTAQTMHTEAGRLVGTVQYMAPEQLDTELRDLDARCDVYALGVLLFKLLTNRFPHEVQGLPVFTAAQVIREDAPPRPGSIIPELKGDLETIMLKALAKDPARRYRTAGSLGRDLVRFLADKPIHARRASLAHRARLFARRHKTELRAAAIIILVIGIAAAIVIYQRFALDGSPETSAPIAAESTGSTDDSPATPRREEANGSEAAEPAAAPTNDADERPGVPDDVVIPDWFIIDAASGPITALAFEPSGRLLITASDQLDTTLWDLDTREQVFTAGDHDAPVTHIAFSSDGSLLITAADDGRVVVLDREANRIERLIRHECRVVHAMAYDDASGRVAIACDDLTVRLFDAEGEEAHVLRGSTGAFHSLTFSRDGTQLAGGSDRGAISIWDAATGALQRRLDDLPDRVVDLAFRDGAVELVAVAADGTARRWSLADEASSSSPIHLEIEDPANVRIASSGDCLVYQRENGLAVIELDHGRHLRHMQPMPREIDITAIAITPDGRRVAVGGSRGSVLLIPIEGAW